MATRDTKETRQESEDKQSRRTDPNNTETTRLVMTGQTETCNQVRASTLSTNEKKHQLFKLWGFLSKSFASTLRESEIHPHHKEWSWWNMVAKRSGPHKKNARKLCNVCQTEFLLRARSLPASPAACHLLLCGWKAPPILCLQKPHTTHTHT